MPAVGPPLGRLHVITDTRDGRDPLPVVRAALAAGAPVVQVRVEDGWTDRAAYELALRAARLCRDAGATCLVNDRLHVALAVTAALAAEAASADGHVPPVGGHVGADDLPVRAARRILGPAPVLGGTARDPDTARAHAAAGATYLGVGPAYRSTTKDGLPDPFGPAGVAAVAAAVPLPVIAIGGVTAAHVPDLLAAGAHGIAVTAAIATAADPHAATVALLTALNHAAATRQATTSGPVTSGRATSGPATSGRATSGPVASGPATDAVTSRAVAAGAPATGRGAPGADASGGAACDGGAVSAAAGGGAGR
jgi:thiamine-phosphate pyrophosphorylase